MEPLDFLPERIRMQRARRKRLMRQGYLLVACVAALAVLGYLRQGRIAQARAESELLGRQRQTLDQQLQLRDSLERQQAELLVKKRINDTLGTRVEALDLLAELGRVVPSCIVLTNLSLDTTDVSVPFELVGGARPGVRPGVAPGPNGAVPVKAFKRIRMTLTGVAPRDVDVAAFIGQMSASPLFEDVNMGYAKNVVFRGRSAREFQASCYVVR